MKNVYFLSDAHLGSRAIAHGRTQERRLVNFLDSIKHNAAAVYLLGDIFDFWYEFKLVVPKGYTRFLGKISELTDLGVEVHFFIGKHSRLKREGGKEPEYMGEDKEPLVLFTKNYLKDHPDINYFIYGHRHIMLDLMLSRTSRMLMLGDWIQDFSYAVFDGENMFLEQYVEGESQYS